MRKTILMQLVALFAFSTLAMAQTPLSTGNSQGFTFGQQIPTPTAATAACVTDFDTTTPASPTVRRIQVTRNAHRDLGYCAYDLQFFTGGLPVTDLKWTVNDVSLAGSANRKEVSVPAMLGQTKVCVTYLVNGKYAGSDCNTYLILP